MKRFILLLATALATTVINAQTVISGTLKDSITQETEPYATVRIYKADNRQKPVAMSLTDADGRISQQLKGSGRYIITFTAVGKAAKEQSLTLSGQHSIDLGTVFLHDDSQSLGEVTVSAQKPIVKMETDRMSYSVSDDVDSRSSTVLDMLRKVPMVTVDGQDNITVNGSSSFKVYVDGKPNAMMSSNPKQVFKAMPATMVKSIEVVTNPGAKYDAEGAVGVLNLVMNREQGAGGHDNDGYNGSIAASAGNREAGADGYLSFQKGKFSMSANASYNYQKLNGITADVVNEQTTSDGTATTHAYSDLKQHQNFVYGNVSMNYDIDSMSTLGATVGGMMFRQKQNTPMSYALAGGYYGDGINYSALQHERPKWRNMNLSADYQRFFDRERKRSLTLSYLFSLDSNHSDHTYEYQLLEGVPTVDLTDRQSLNHMLSRENTVQIDYTSPLSKSLNLSVGAKYIGRRNTSNAAYYTGSDGQYTYQQSLSTDYKYVNHIGAAYAEGTGKWGQWGAKAGLRYEYTWQNVEYKLGNGDDFSKHYGNLVPSASLTYNFSDTRNIGLTYNLRISRPGISYLNPYVTRTPLSQTYGNTMLDVAKNNNLRLVYNSFSPKLMVNFSLGYSFCNNDISQYQFYRETILHTTYGNILKERSIWLSTYINWAIATKTRLMLNADGSYSDERSSLLSQKMHGWHGNIFAGLQQTLPWNLKASINAMASTKDYSLQGWSSGFQMAFATLSKDFFKDKLNVSVTGVTGLRHDGRLVMNQFSHGSDFTTRQKITVPVAMFRVRIAYTFGNMKKQVGQHQSNIQNDFIDQQRQGSQLPTGSGMGQ